MFRYRDADNYYVTRANALENNVRLYHVVKGDHQQFASWNGAVASGHWHSLQATAKGDHFVVFWDDKKVIRKHNRLVAQLTRFQRRVRRFKRPVGLPLHDLAEVRPQPCSARCGNAFYSFEPGV